MSLGRKGEQIAAAYLESRGFDILETNWAYRASSGTLVSEIDIIARKGKTIVFVEVKSGSSEEPGFRPEVHMTDAKIRKVEKGAKVWLTQNATLSDDVRIDLIAVDFSKKPPSIRHYENVNAR